MQLQENHSKSKQQGVVHAAPTSAEDEVDCDDDVKYHGQHMSRGESEGRTSGDGVLLTMEQHVLIESSRKSNGQ